MSKTTIKFKDAQILTTKTLRIKDISSIKMANDNISPDTIDLIQQYLTVSRNKKILDIKDLLKRHSTDEILNLLIDMSKEYKSTLQDIITLDITDSSLDKTISHWFRLIIAINILRSINEE